MKLKINKACDLSSISVLPPQSRRPSGASSRVDSASIFGRSQTASQLRSQQAQQSQQALSQGVSSQHGLLSQFSQNSQEENLTNEKIGSQENSVRRTSCLPPISYAREESQMVVSRTSNNFIRKWPGQEHKCQVSEELEHRIGIVETSLSRLGMILDSVQSDIVQVNKGTKEVALETEWVRQKLIIHDDSLQSMSKGQEDIKTCLDQGFKSLSDQLDIKTCLDQGFKSLSDQLKQIKNLENTGKIISMLSALSEKADTQMAKLQNDLHNNFCKEIQAISSSMKISKHNEATLPVQKPKAVSFHAPPQKIQPPNNETRHLKAQPVVLLPKVEVGGWTSVKPERATSKFGNLSKTSNQMKPTTKQLDLRVIIESDEEPDEGFSCLLKAKGAEIDEYSAEEVKEETARILRKARRRKRKYCNTIIIN